MTDTILSFSFKIEINFPLAVPWYSAHRLMASKESENS